MELKVLQWNVWYKENPQNIVAEIRRLNPDVVCAQELMTNEDGKFDTAKEISQGTGYNYVYVEGDTWDNREDKESQGNAIFSKYPITLNQTVYVTSKKHNPQNATVEGRVYFDVNLELGGQKLTIGTTHLSYSDRFEENDLRLSEYKNLRDVLTQKQNNFIFCADLNSNSGGKISSDISTYLKNAGPSFDRPTWTTKPFDYHGFKEDKLNWRLDYMFATNDMVIKNTQIVDTKLSDHLPILTTFEI